MLWWDLDTRSESSGCGGGEELMRRRVRMTPEGGWLALGARVGPFWGGLCSCVGPAGSASLNDRVPVSGEREGPSSCVVRVLIPP